MSKVHKILVQVLSVIKEADHTDVMYSVIQTFDGVIILLCG